METRPLIGSILTCYTRLLARKSKRNLFPYAILGGWCGLTFHFRQGRCCGSNFAQGHAGLGGIGGIGQDEVLLGWLTLVVIAEPMTRGLSTVNWLWV